jgi:hypothetical protein
MKRKGRPPVQRFFRWEWVAGLLLVTVIVIIGAWRRQSSRPNAAPLQVSEIVHTSAPPVGKPPVIGDKPSTVSAAGGLDICGLGKVQLDPDDPSAAGRYLRELTSNVRGRWLSAMLNSGDIRARSAGLFLENKLTDSAFARPIADQTRDALVQLAVGAGDPVIYAMAVYACYTYSDPAPTGSCQQITLNTWARLDSDNAVPWLLLAGEAHKSNDLTAEAAAFGQAAKANKVDAYNFSLYTYSESELPNDVTPLERWSLAMQMVGIEAATASLHYSPAAKYCSEPAMSDADVRQQCDALAELLVRKGTNLLDLSMGTNIGARAGWPKSRVAALKEERDALMQAITQATPNSDDDLWSCDGVRHGNAYMGEWQRLGELGAARESLERSGETVSELAQKHRDFIDRIQRAARQRREASSPDPPP